MIGFMFFRLFTTTTKMNRLISSFFWLEKSNKSNNNQPFKKDVLRSFLKYLFLRSRVYCNKRKKIIYLK